MFLLGLVLARELLQMPLPEQVCTWIRSDRTVQGLADHVYHRLFDQRTIRDRILEKPRFYIRVRERLRDKIPAYRFLVSAAFSEVFVPREEDREQLELPGVLSMLYYLVRPIRFAQRLWTLAIRRNNTTPLEKYQDTEN
jgi:hypothetical protein